MDGEGDDLLTKVLKHAQHLAMREQALYKLRRDLSRAEQQIDGIRYGYISQGIDGRHAWDREAALRSQLVEDPGYIELLAEKERLEDEIDDLTAGVDHLRRMHDIHLTTLHRKAD